MTTSMHSGGTQTELVETDEHTVLLLRRPDRPPTATVLLIHAPGENRAGNNYLFSHGAARMAAAGVAAVSFDLSGCGDSLGERDLGTWLRQIDAAIACIDGRIDTAAVHLVARGASAALLPEAWPRGQRVALGPPTPGELRALADSDVSDFVVGRHPCPRDLARLWCVVGVAPNLVGGLRLPTQLLRTLAGRLERSRWDVEVTTPTRPARVRSRILLPSGDLLVRHQMTRLGLFDALIEFVTHMTASSLATDIHHREAVG